MEYIDTMVKSIVGLQNDITRLTGKSKLRQNKEARDIQGAGKALKARDNRIDDAMLRCLSAFRRSNDRPSPLTTSRRSSRSGGRP